MSAALPSAAQDYKLLLKKGQWFSQISPALQSRLLEEATVHKLTANQVVFSRGEPFNGVFAVINGMVKIVGYGANDSGKESLLALLEAPEWFGELSFF
ncbi:MAG TPA: cyclic nucleotide-binding domain-containing protein, partial [Agitococcus sp.]|nr:cyclic nucleotide-binding domain-containing protein [Agitococcus sp.]